MPSSSNVWRCSQICRCIDNEDDVGVARLHYEDAAERSLETLLHSRLVKSGSNEASYIFLLKFSDEQVSSRSGQNFRLGSAFSVCIDQKHEWFPGSTDTYG